jgi:hypothetical protein
MPAPIIEVVNSGPLVSTEPVLFKIHMYIPNSLVNIVPNVTVTYENRVGNIFVKINSERTPGIASQVVTPKTVIAKVGKLEPGMYYVNSDPQVEHKMVIHVYDFVKCAHVDNHFVVINNVVGGEPDLTCEFRSAQGTSVLVLDSVEREHLNISQKHIEAQISTFRFTSPASGDLVFKDSSGSEVSKGWVLGF